MKKFTKIRNLGTMILTVGVLSITAFAASNYNTPAEAVAGLTGKTVESVIKEKTETGKAYGTIADEAGKLTAFKAEMIAIKKDALAEKVAAGIMTQEKADEILAAIEENQANCDGTGTKKIGQMLGAGFGGMNGECRGNGQGKRQGDMGRGQGNCRIIY